MDPTHPAAPLPIRAFYQRVPLYKTSAFSLRAFPKALLELPPAPVSYPALEREVLSREMGKRGDRVDVSLLWTGPKSIHKSAVVRTRLFRRFKTALGLALTRGVDAVEWGGGKGKGKGKKNGGKAPTRLRLVEGEDGDEMRRCVLSSKFFLVHVALFAEPTARLDVFLVPFARGIPYAVSAAGRQHPAGATQPSCRGHGMGA